MKKYTLTLNENQMLLVRDALDLYSRIGIGQFEIISEVYAPFERDELMRNGLNVAKKACGHPPNGSYSINNPTVNDRFRQAFDICQVVRNKVAWSRNPEGGIYVQFDTPRQLGEEPLPTCEIVGDK